MILEITNKNGLEISYIDKDGMVQLQHIPLKNPKRWVVCKPNDPEVSTKFRNWDNKPVKEVDSKYNGKFKNYEYLWKLQKHPKMNHIFDLNLPKLLFLDIETLIPQTGNSNFKQFTDNTPTPITTMAFVLNMKCFVFGSKVLQEYQIDEISQRLNQLLAKIGEKEMSFKYIYFENEFDMIHTFLKSVMPKAAIITGWNVFEFDWKYIFNRYTKLGGNMLEFSPTLSAYNYSLNHVGVIDYANIFAKWDTSIEVKENNSLDFVASEILGINKVSYSGNLNELYENDYVKYVEYNAWDAILVYIIDARKKIMNVMCNIAHTCNIPIPKADKSTVIGESLLSHGFYHIGKVIVDEFQNNENEDSSYEGAFVKDPVTGFYRFLACFDFSSLYPTIMRQWNISPESFVGMFDKDKIEKYKNNPNYITAINGAVYLKKQSVLNDKLTALFKKRKFAQGKMKECQSNAERLKTELYNVHGIVYDEYIKNKK